MDEKQEKDLIKKIRDAEALLNQALCEAAEHGIEAIALEPLRIKEMGCKSDLLQFNIKLAKIL
jgi:hypothetical protein